MRYPREWLGYEVSAPVSPLVPLGAVVEAVGFDFQGGQVVVRFLDEELAHAHRPHGCAQVAARRLRPLTDGAREAAAC